MDNPHQGAGLAAHGRDRIVARVSAPGRRRRRWPRPFGVSLCTMRKWLARFRAGGGAALVHPASAPARVARRLPDRLVALALHLRRDLRLTGAAIAAKLGLARSTVARWPTQAGLGRLARLDPPEPVRRYQRARPGALIQLDSKTLGGFDQPGHRVTGTRAGCRNPSRAGTACRSRPMTRRGWPMSRGRATSAATPRQPSCSAPCAGAAPRASAPSGS